MKEISRKRKSSLFVLWFAGARGRIGPLGGLRIVGDKRKGGLEGLVAGLCLFSVVSSGVEDSHVRVKGKGAMPWI